MAERTPRVLLDGLIFPEGPRWHAGRLWFSDIHAYEVVAVDLAGRRETIVSVPQRPSGLGWLPDGQLLVVSMVDRKLLCLGPGGLTELADLSALTSFYCNDMVVDAKGRSYIGNFGFDLHGGEEPRPANLVMVTPEGNARVVADELLFPNGTVITPDGSTLIVAESRGRRLTAFSIGSDGSLSNRRVWAQLNVVPDGICLDAEGCIWAAVPSVPGAAVRVAEGGEITDRIDIADRGCFACMLGGPERRHLFMLEAFTSYPERAKATGPGNGRVSIVEVDVPGAGLP